MAQPDEEHRPEKILGRLALPPAADPAAPPVNLSQLLIAAQLIATDTDRANGTKEGMKWDAETPPSLQVLKSGMTKATAAWLKRTGFAGGGVGLLTTVGGAAVAIISPVRAGLGDPIAVALLASGTLIIAATVLALAVFVAGDLAARGRATAARHSARAEVVVAFLNAFERATAEAATDRSDTAERAAGNKTAEESATREKRKAEERADAERQAAEEVRLRRRAELISAINAKTVWIRTAAGGDWLKVTAYKDGAEGFQVRVDGGDWKPLDRIVHFTTDRS